MGGTVDLDRADIDVARTDIDAGPIGDDALAKKGRTECLVALQTNSSLLADRITQAYTDERFAAYAPTAIYIIKMGETCRPYINKERAAFGLGPQ